MKLACFPLVIDPTLIFSTFSGSTSNNFGYTATFDRDGFLYSGSTAFGGTYPTTTGAYDRSFNGGIAVIDKEPIRKAKAVNGIFLANPPKASISFV